MIQLDPSKRAARMLAAGRLTVTFRSPSGQHITLTAKCRAPQDDGRWVASSLADAKVVFIEVPNQEGWNDKVAKVTRAKGLVPDPHADDARVYCARMLLRYVAGESLPPSLEVFEEDRCGRCGRALTDPVSIERGIGPECYGRETGSQHETKQRPEPTVATGTAGEIVAAFGESWLAAERREVEAARKPQTLTDKDGVYKAEGDWRQRRRIASAERRERSAERASSPDSQLRELPGTTWEDIFGGPEAVEAEAARLQSRRDERAAQR